MNAALRVLRVELGWLDDAERRATSAAIIDAERIPARLTFAYLEQIGRERRAIEDAIEMIEAVIDEWTFEPGPLLAMLENGEARP